VFSLCTKCWDSEALNYFCNVYISLRRASPSGYLSFITIGAQEVRKWSAQFVRF